MKTPQQPRKARARKNSGSTISAQKAGTSARKVLVSGEKPRTQPKAAKHICDRCHHTFLELAMRQVSLYDGDYTIWTTDRAAYFRSHAMKYPTRVWLCGSCYNEAQQAQAAEWRIGEPASVSVPATQRPQRRGKISGSQLHQGQ
jgi:hypothetical protein